MTSLAANLGFNETTTHEHTPNNNIYERLDNTLKKVTKTSWFTASNKYYTGCLPEYNKRLTNIPFWCIWPESLDIPAGGREREKVRKKVVVVRGGGGRGRSVSVPLGWPKQ